MYIRLLTTTLISSLVLYGSAILAHAQEPLRVDMQLSSKTILLGEPVWIDIAVTNVSAKPLQVDLGSRCSNDPIHLEIPLAEAGDVHRSACSVDGILSCLGSPGPVLPPGGSLSDRYLLHGDFHIAHSGEYTILASKKIAYGPAREGKPSSFTPLPEEMSSDAELRLHVLPEDATRLTYRERSLAGRVVRLAGSQAEFDEVNTLAEGLADSPVEGMAGIFHDWLKIQQMQPYLSYAVEGLKHLNTAQARSYLAEAALGSDTSLRQQAMSVLSEMGDKSYLPLFRGLLNNNEDGIRYSAIRGLGLLGGEEAVSPLADIIRTSPHHWDRENAIMALSDTDSVAAVPVLISALNLAGGQEAARNALEILTHHWIFNGSENPDPLKEQAAWQSWWFQKQGSMPVYSPYECMRPEEFPR